MFDHILSGFTFGLICISLSFFTFFILNRFLLDRIPKSAQNTSRQMWKWKNIMKSLIHSVIAGLFALLCIFWYPEMVEDLINSYSVCTHILVSFTVGYFVHDFLDISLNYRKRSSYELMVHHTFAILCFGLTVITSSYLGYSLIALLVEVNSAFLHVRQLFIIVGTQKTYFWYRFNSGLNIVTYIIFRIAVLAYMLQWLLLHKDELSMPVYALGSVGLAVIIPMNIVLFIRICTVDFFSTQKPNFKSEDIAEGTKIRNGGSKSFLHSKNSKNVMQ